MTDTHKTVAKPRRRWFQFSLRTLLVLVRVLWHRVTTADDVPNGRRAQV